MIALIEKGTRRVYSAEAYAAYFSPLVQVGGRVQAGAGQRMPGQGRAGIGTAHLQSRQ